MLLPNRNVVLSGVFVDGQAFSFELNTNDIGGQDYFDVEAIVTVTLVDRLAGDYNGDDVVDASRLPCVEKVVGDVGCQWIRRGREF